MNKTTKVNYNTDSIKKKRFKILIVDDDVKVADVLKEYFELRGHTVYAVDEGSRGISNLVDNCYDLIFIDYHLDSDGSPACQDKKSLCSFMDGSIFFECIMEMNTKAKLIFAYTGDTSESAIEKFKKVGMDGAIFKPIEEAVLNKLMTSLETREDTDKIHLSKLIKQYKKSIVLF